MILKEISLKHFTNRVLVVRPAAFGYNSETAGSNAFQNQVALSRDEILYQALIEFDRAVEILRDAGVEVFVAHDTPFPEKPDAVFPNNWISFHSNGELILYPMEARNRRCERRLELVVELQQKLNFSQVFDLSYFEEKSKFLEGTGSVVFDHENRKAYAAISSRTNEEVLNKLCAHLNYNPILFHAEDEQGLAIYHTNVIMCVGANFVVICLEAIATASERVLILETIRNSGKEVVDISMHQLKNFAGNMLALKGRDDDALLVLSATAKESLNQNQLNFLSGRVRLVVLPIETIEAIGGGSARCMLAEIF
jgi:hypothetical protein